MSLSKYPQFHGTGVPKPIYVHYSKTFQIADGKVVWNAPKTHQYEIGTNQRADERRFRRKFKISARQWRINKASIINKMMAA